MYLTVVPFVACLAALFSMAFANRPPLPVSVDSIENQCLAHHYVGACNDINFSIHGINCANIWCKRQFPTANGVRIGSIGHAARGTKCGAPGERKVCENGWCVNLGSRRMPVQFGPNPTRHCRRTPTPPRSPPLWPPVRRYF